MNQRSLNNMLSVSQVCSLLPGAHFIREIADGERCVDAVHDRLAGAAPQDAFKRREWSMLGFHAVLRVL